MLIVNADDLGMYPSLNEAVIRSIRYGIGSSCSLMTTCPGSAHAIDLLHQHPDIRFGVHLTLVSDSPGMCWAPLSTPDMVPSLVDANGTFMLAARAAELLATARLTEIELEVRAQLHAVLDAGLEPTHLDWHCLADGGRDDITELTFTLAREYGLAARVWLPAGREQARRRGLPVVDHDFLDSFALSLDGKDRQLRALLRQLPAGLTEWAVHPGASDPAARRLDAGWQVRRSDLDALIDPATSDVVRDEHIVIIDYTTLRRAWTNAAG